MASEDAPPGAPAGHHPGLHHLGGGGAGVGGAHSLTHQPEESRPPCPHHLRRHPRLPPHHSTYSGHRQL